MTPWEAFRRAFTAYVERLPPILRLLADSPRLRTVRAAERVGLGRECRDALNRLDTALDDAEAAYTEALEAERDHWRRVGQHAMRWQLWAALTPGLTWPDVSATAASLIRSRVACDWSEQELGEVVQGLLEGWVSR